MNKVLIDNCNSRIKDEDIVYHIGDFCFKNSPGGKDGEGMIFSARSWEKHLKGKWIHIKGNHDKNNSCKTNIECMTVKAGGRKIHVTHRPENARPDMSINLVGHVHEKWKFKELTPKSLMINMSIDMWGFKPVHINEIMVQYHRYMNGVIDEMGKERSK